MGIIRFRYLQLMALAEFHDDIEKIHRVEIKLVAQGLVGLQTGKIRLVIDVFNNLQDKGFDIFSRHVYLQIEPIG